MKRLILLALVLALTSCVTERRCNRKYPPQQKQIDSVYIESVRHDTTVNIQYLPDTTQAAQPSYKPSFLSNKYCTTAAWVKSDTLYHNLITKQQSIPVTFRDVIRKNTRVQFHTAWLTKEVRFVPMLVKIFAWIGLVSFLFGLSYIVFKILKPL